MKLRQFFRTVFPHVCLLCERNTCIGESLLCEDCLTDWQTLLNEPCRMCSQPASQCTCKRNQSVHALIWYTSPQAYRLLQMLKHSADADRVAFLAKPLASVCTERFDAVTYIPRSRKALRREGYDQSRLLAKGVAAELNLPLIRTLECIGTVEQKFLSASQRMQQVKGKYLARPAEVSNYPRLLLIDDICTTGATLHTCAALLRKAGARSVICAALAKTQTNYPIT